MSFSGKVKEELSRQISPARHCRIAELSAVIGLCGRIQISARGEYRVWIHTENIFVARKFFTLVRKTFNIYSEVAIRRNMTKGTCTYTVLIKDRETAERVLQATKVLEPSMGSLVVQNTCCRRAYLRGAFLASGSISDPEKGYHYEIVTQTEERALKLKNIINSFGMDAKVVQRKNHYLAYLKEGAQLVDTLNIMEAHLALMDLENVRIVKEMRNTVNRQVNCETANINKTVTAAGRQMEDIRYVQDTIGLHRLPEGLEEIANLRVNQPEASLKELGTMLDSPIGKSGVNHRLKKISLIADGLRGELAGVIKEENKL